MSKLRLVLLWSIFAIQCPSLFGQVSNSANLQVGHDFWGFKEGVPDDVEVLAQTSDGFLWLGSSTGLFRFDGIRFELFHSPFGGQLLSTNILALFAPSSGGLWIGYTFGGFSFLKDGKIMNYGGEAAATGTVRSFAQDKDGIVWAATSSGLWRFDHSHWQHAGPGVRGSAFEVRFDRNGTLWALTGSGNASSETQLIYLPKGTRQFHVAASHLFFPGFTQDADGYVATDSESKQLFDDTESDAGDRPTAYPLVRKGCTQIVDRTGSVWIIPPEPIVLRSPPSGQQLSDVLAKASPSDSETYQVNPSIPAKLVDREGNVWFGEQKGLHRFFYSHLTKQALPKSAEDSAFFTVTPDEAGAVWITAGNGQLFNIYFVDHDRVKAKQTPGPLAGFAYRARDKTAWFGGQAGLWHLVQGNLIHVDLPKEKADEAYFLQTITEDRRGGMWVSFGRHGLYRLADGIWTSYGGRDDIPKLPMISEFADSLGRVWFGYTDNTLAVLDGDRVQVFGPSDGLRVGNITAIYGRGSEIWIGGEFGLQQFDHGRFHDIHATDEEWLRGISGIVETANEDLWLNGLGGIFHVRRSELSEALKNSAYQVKGEHFGRREGLPGFAGQLRPLNTVVEGTGGRLWFATNNGVVWLDPTRSDKIVPPPPITIESVSADDKNYPLGSGLKFPARTSNVQISYAAVSLSDPEAIHFRYKLEGTDKEWHDVSNATPVSYRNLSPGLYHFSVNATDTNGAWSDAVATAEFTILPAFYQTGWFIALCVVSALAFLYMLYMLRMRQLARQYGMRLEERVSERTRIARDLHDTLLQTFHGLLLRFQTVSQLLPERPEEAKQRLDGAIDQAAEAITEGRDAVQGLRASTIETNDLAVAIRTVGEELAADETNQSSAVFQVEVEGTPRNLRPILRDEVYRLAGEALRNAFWHAQARRIEVEIRYDPKQLRLRVRDDGKGIDPEVLAGEGREGHYGLHGMRERAKLVGGKVAVWSARDSGTEVELIIPASTAYATATRRRWWLAEKLSGKGDDAKDAKLKS